MIYPLFCPPSDIHIFTRLCTRTISIVIVFVNYLAWIVLYDAYKSNLSKFYAHMNKVIDLYNMLDTLNFHLQCTTIWVISIKKLRLINWKSADFTTMQNYLQFNYNYVVIFRNIFWQASTVNSFYKSHIIFSWLIIIRFGGFFCVEVWFFYILPLFISEIHIIHEKVIIFMDS